MIVVHRGFDTIILSIQANITRELFEALEVERELAEEARETRPFSFRGIDFDLLPHGGNGYRFILKGGPLEAQWFFKKPNVRDSWGIRVSVGSVLLATQGLGFARAYINETLAQLGIAFVAHQVSIARGDFCVDVLAPEFELHPENFVMHSHANRADHQTSNEHIRSNGKSGRFSSVTIGKMPGRQVIIYDKRKEVIEKQKPIWWNIWNSNLAALDQPPISRANADSSRVWRIEVRAGKKLLKDRWQVRQWGEFDRLFGDIVNEALQKIRYCDPDPSDTNRARWPSHPLWQLAARTVSDDLFEMRSDMEPDQVKCVHREAHIELITRLVFGNLITQAALEGATEAGLETFVKASGARMWEMAEENLGATKTKLAAARARYRFV